MFTKSEVAARIDHAVLKPEMTGADVVAAAQMCRERGVGALCVRPDDVVLAALELAGSKTKVCAVIGFPHGAHRTATKELEARLALEDGAQELDMVMNIGHLLAGDTNAVRSDIAAVVERAHASGAIVKVILETCLLTREHIVRACLCARDGGADFVKTSTGFAGGGATREAVQVMLDTVGDCMQVKASGGIRDWDGAVAFLEQGCTRLGVGATEAVLDGGVATGKY